MERKKLKSKDGKVSEVGLVSPDSANTVQFAKPLEHDPRNIQKDTEKSAYKSFTSKIVSGVTIEDRKVGKGVVAKKESRLAMRFLGKLKNGKIFQSNTKGNLPFSYHLAHGGVVGGWDVGLVGMKVGGERRLIIPANLDYGSNFVPGIPPNSDLIFDGKNAG
jgi:FK506-binding nuclear protein